MKILKVEAWNFGSYDHFEMELDNLGLALIYGKTGSGKSTIMDMVSWGLYGTTSKRVTSDDVRSWGATKSTTVVIHTDTAQVTRVRGKANENDAYYRLYGRLESNPIRGKDSRDTQVLINEILGCDGELFHTASYFSEFNPTAMFFLAKAKERRSVFEKIAPLQYPNQLQEKITDAKKETRKMVQTTEGAFANVTGQLSVLRQQVVSTRRQAESFERTRLQQMQALAQKASTFNDDKRNRLEAIERQIKEGQRNQKGSHETAIRSLQSEIKNLKDVVCGECGQSVEETLRGVLLRKLHGLQQLQTQQKQVVETVKSLKTQLAAEAATVNQYGELLYLEQHKPNPFTLQASRTDSQLVKAESEGVTLKEQLEGLQRRLGALEQLSGITVQLRGLLLEEAVKECEQSVNNYLTTTFDSEFVVKFTVEGDDLDVSITKNGYEASYTQLSKGQRRLLSLCFTISVMEQSANAAGAHMDLLLLDEPSDGMDEDMKAKAFDLYQELATRHASILVIEHSSTTQALFDKKYQVTMEADRSNVNEE